MRIKLGRTHFSFEDNIYGKTVIASIREDGVASVRVAELNRVGGDINLLWWKANEEIYFLPSEYEIISQKNINCSDSNVGKGWEGYYDKFHGKIRK